MKYLLETPVKGISGREKFTAAIHWRNGVLITDEPEKLGGKDIGPDPYTLLLSSLISCTLATLRMYLEHKGLAIPEMVVAANMFYRFENEATAVYIERRITIQQLPDSELLDRLLQVAESCPVSKILKGSIRIVTELESAGSQTLKGDA
jgi:putative redox protein